MATFVCASCDADKPLTGARSIDGGLWCTECADSADQIDRWVAETEPTREINVSLLYVLLEQMTVTP